MSDLSKKTLSQLDTVTSVSDDDNVLIERNGRLKKISASPILNDNIFIVDLSWFDYSENENEEPLM